MDDKREERRAEERKKKENKGEERGEEKGREDKGLSLTIIIKFDSRHNRMKRIRIH